MYSTQNIFEIKTFAKQHNILWNFVAQSTFFVCTIPIHSERHRVWSVNLCAIQLEFRQTSSRWFTRIDQPTTKECRSSLNLLINFYRLLASNARRLINDRFYGGQHELRLCRVMVNCVFRQCGPSCSFQMLTKFGLNWVRIITRWS